MQTAGTLIFSPHPDDAAFSIGGLLSMQALPSPIVIITVFGKTDFLGKFGFQSRYQSATKTRKNQDIEFSKSIGAELIYLELPEASIRIGKTAKEIFKANHLSSHVTIIPSNVTLEIANLLETRCPKLVFSPMGLGGHEDHLVVRNLLLDITKKYEFQLIFYEDMPYAAKLKNQQIEQYIYKLNPDYSSIFIPLKDNALGRKLNLASIYETQVSSSLLNTLKKYSLSLEPTLGAERLWAPINQIENKKGFESCISAFPTFS